MADAKDTTGTGAPDDTKPAAVDRGGTGGANSGNALAADGAAPAGDPLAYRDKGDNPNKRIAWIERVVVDHFYGGDIRRFDAAAGLDIDA